MPLGTLDEVDLENLSQCFMYLKSKMKEIVKKICPVFSCFQSQEQLSTNPRPRWSSDLSEFVLAEVLRTVLT